MKKKILFLIHDLGQGGAEKVLVNLVNNMDYSKFDITVMAIFGGGVNEQFLNKKVKYKTVFRKMIPANSHIMKLFTPRQLHEIFIKDFYDIEVAYLEGPSARIISGCANPKTKLISWIHSTISTKEELAHSFRNYEEASECYLKFDFVSFVSREIQNSFCKILSPIKGYKVLYNTIESNKILALAKEPVAELNNCSGIRLVSTGSLKPVKGFDRLLRIVKRLKNENYDIHLYLLGKGPLQKEFLNYINDNSLEDSVTLLGYQINPYKYVSKCDLFVCSSHSEGFSTAVTEALIVGTPVVATKVSGMGELLGEQNEYGLVTKNDEEALYRGIKRLLDDPKLLSKYKGLAAKRGEAFSTLNTVKQVEQVFSEF